MSAVVQVMAALPPPASQQSANAAGFHMPLHAANSNSDDETYIEFDGDNLTVRQVDERGCSHMAVLSPRMAVELGRIIDALYPKGMIIKYD
jgi:hypothetical protein